MNEQIPSLTSFLLKHSLDILLIGVFFYIFFFCKPNAGPEEELNPDEQPNELEKILVTEPEEIEAEEES